MRLDLGLVVFKSNDDRLRMSLQFLLIVFSILASSTIPLAACELRLLSGLRGSRSTPSDDPRALKPCVVSITVILQPLS